MFDSDGRLDCPIAIQIDGNFVYKTPKEIITPLTWEYLRAHNFYQKGFLPNGRGWVNESNKCIQAIEILDNEFVKWKNKRNG